MKNFAIALSGAALCAFTPAAAQTSDRDATTAGSVPADRGIEVEVVETVFPAERVIPRRQAPVVIERVEIEDVPDHAGADFTRYPSVTTAQRVVTKRRMYTQGSQGKQVEVIGLPAGARVVQFDREAWLAECRSRLATYDETDRGKVLGAVIGGAIGGVAGNRIAGDGNRVLGTVVGAGIGAAAGSAVGDSIDDTRRGAASPYGECEAYLDDYMESAAAGELRHSPSYYGQEYMLVPVTVSEPQKAVYREVTPEE